MSSTTTAGWITLGTGFASIGGATALMYSGYRSHVDDREARRRDPRQGVSWESRSLPTVGLVVGAVGLAAVSVGVVLIVLGNKTTSHVGVAAGLDRLSLTGQF